MAATRVGVLVQCNYGTRENLRIAGVPVGREIPSEDPYAAATLPSDIAERGSIIVVVATDAPLLPHQLKRLARRVSLGHRPQRQHRRQRFRATSSSLSRPPTRQRASSGTSRLKMVPNDSLDPLFAATVQATEEAIVNAMVAAQT